MRFDACCASAERLVAVLAIDREVSLVLMHDVHACPGIAPLTSGLCCCKPMRRTDCVVYAFIRLHCVCVSSSVVWLVYGQSTLCPKYIHMNRSVIYICHAQIYTSVTTQIYIYHDSNTHVFQCIHFSPRFPIKYVYLLQCAVCSTCRVTTLAHLSPARRPAPARRTHRAPATHATTGAGQPWHGEQPGAGAAGRRPEHGQA